MSPLKPTVRLGICLAAALVALASVWCASPSLRHVLSAEASPLPAPDPPTDFVRVVPFSANDIVYNPSTHLLYASVPSSAGPTGNRIATIDPTTGAVTNSAFIGSEPRKLALADDNQSLYVSLDGVAAIRRFDIPSQTAGAQFSIGQDSFYGIYDLTDLAVAPGNPNLVAVARSHRGVSPPEAGVAVFDTGIQRPVTTPGHSAASDFLAFSASANTVYGGAFSSGVLNVMTIDASGVSITSTKTFSGSRIRFDNGLVYGSGGQVINPATGNLAGTFAGVGSGPFTTDSSVGRAYYITGSQSSTNYTLTLRAFDISTFLQIGTLSIPGVNGQVSSLVRWGSNGLAFRTDGGQLFLIQSTLVPSGDPIPTPTATPSPTATPTPTPFETFVRTVRLANNDIAFAPSTQLFYAGVPSSVGSGGNSIRSIDPNTGATGSPVFIGSEPFKLVMADDGQTMYAALDGAAAVSRFNVVTQTADPQFSIGQGGINKGPFFANDLAAPPGNPNVVAVSRTNRVSQSADGVAIYDNGVRRTNMTGNSYYVESSNDPSRLYSSGFVGTVGSQMIDRLSVDANGVTYIDSTPVLGGGDLRFDNGLIYNVNGGVIDPEAKVMKGSFTGLGVGMNSIMTTDAANGRAFFLLTSSQNSTATLKAYDLSTFTPVGSITFSIPASSDPPSRLLRWGTNGLAFRIASHVIFLQSALVSSSGVVPPNPGPTPTPTPTPTPYIPTFVRPVDLLANDIAYHSPSQTIYASVPSPAGVNGNSITPINPQTGAIGTSVVVGSEPNKLAMSDDGSVLHVSLAGANAIRQFNISTQTPGIQFSFPPPTDMEVLPGSPQSLAVSDGTGDGVAIYDNGVRRTNASKGGAYGIGPLEFGSSPTTLYGYDSFSSGFELVEFTVNSNGVTGTNIGNNLIANFANGFEFGGGRLYSAGGRVVDPVGTMLVGTFANFGSQSILAVDTSLNRVFYVAPSGSNIIVSAFDTNTFLPIGSVFLPNISGTPVRLFRWGTNGLAFNTVGASSKVYLVQSTLVSNTGSMPTGIQLAATSFTGSEENGTATISVVRTGDLSAGSTINYSTTDGTAVAGVDYTAVSGTLTFAPGQLSGSIQVPIRDDQLRESGANETFTVTLSNPTGAILQSPASAVVGILDNINLPVVTIMSASTPEGNSGTKLLTFPLTLSTQSIQIITVNYTTQSISATAGVDYVSQSGTVTFPPGTTSNVIEITINGDIQVEANETFFVTITGGTNFSGGFMQAVGTILNDDNTVQFSPASYSVSEGSTLVTITAVRNGNVLGPATVRYATSDATDVNFNCNPNTAGQITGAASRKCDYHIAAGRLRFAAGQISKQIVLSIVDDVYVEPTESLTVTLSDPTGATLGTNTTATVNITDNDTPGQANPIDGTGFYVRMLYVDLLSREPDTAGFNGWVHRIDFCGQPGEPPPPCDRVTVGGDGFLRSAELFDREFFVIRLYRTALGRILRYDDVADLAYVSGFLTDADLELNKQELVTDIMSRSEFGGIYNSLSNAQYVDTMISTAAVTLPAGVRDGWVNALNGLTKTRAQVFRELSERPEVSAKYLHEAQVVSCYYGFFTRNPDGAYLNFLQRLDSGEINLGDLANAFINAAEYRQRFGP